MQCSLIMKSKFRTPESLNSKLPPNKMLPKLHRRLLCQDDLCLSEVHTYLYYVTVLRHGPTAKIKHDKKNSILTVLAPPFPPPPPPQHFVKYKICCDQSLSLTRCSISLLTTRPELEVEEAGEMRKRRSINQLIFIPMKTCQLSVSDHKQNPGIFSTLARCYHRTEIYTDTHRF